MGRGNGTTKPLPWWFCCTTPKKKEDTVKDVFFKVGMNLLGVRRTPLPFWLRQRTMPPQKKRRHLKDVFFKVGMTRFELATPRPPDVYATRLRYIPKYERQK